MKVRSWIKMGFKLIKFLAVLVIVLLMTSTVSEKKIFRVENFNFNKSLGLTAMAEKDEEAKPKPKPVQTPEEPVKKVNSSVKISYKGDLTGYSADCPLCNGKLACLRSYNVYKNGVTSYKDKTYGEVRIVASSKKLPCGSIIKFDSKRVSKNTTYAIVLDRGVTGTSIDLLVPTEAYASKYIGRSSIKYDVLRLGW